MFTDYDVIIAGSGCAGLAAAIYTGRAGLSTMVLERKSMGGEASSRQLVENYPGFANGIMGPDLATAMLEQATNAGAEIDMGEITAITDKGNYKIVKCGNESMTCKGVIIASGSLPRKLGIPGEEEFGGKGVFYCETCDGPLCAGKDVVVAGAGDSGITAALFLEKLGCKVTVVEFLETPKASKIMLDRAEENPNIEVILNTAIKSVKGEDWVTGVEVEDRATGESRVLDVQGLYVRVGLVPNTKFLEGTITLARGGVIPVGVNMDTEIVGIFAAGDVRENSPRQMATAVGDGVTAAMACSRYISTLE